MSKLPKLLYLGYAFPPGVAGQFPELQPAGHLIETCLIDSLRPWFEIRSVGIASIRVETVAPDGRSPGLPHALNLLDTKPELFHRWNSVQRLKAQYRAWVASGWVPDIIVVCNFSPVFNSFVRWLKKQPHTPYLVLYLADSLGLQRKLSWNKRLRYHLKPMVWPDADMVSYMQACIAVSRTTEAFFRARNLPWLWLPNGCDPARALPPQPNPPEKPLRFGYFGTLADHGGVTTLARVFTARPRNAVLEICGFGKPHPKFLELCDKFPQLRLHPPRIPDECLRFAQSCDVLVNPRPNVPGNENNFPSKVFEYALTGRPILSSRLSGVDLILGEEAFYFDCAKFETSLDQELTSICQLSRAELHRRGMAIQNRFLTEYPWSRQGERLASFLTGLLEKK